MYFFLISINFTGFTFTHIRRHHLQDFQRQSLRQHVTIFKGCRMLTKLLKSRSFQGLLCGLTNLTKDGNGRQRLFFEARRDQIRLHFPQRSFNVNSIRIRTFQKQKANEDTQRRIEERSQKFAFQQKGQKWRSKRNLKWGSQRRGWLGDLRWPQGQVPNQRPLRLLSSYDNLWKYWPWKGPFATVERPSRRQQVNFHGFLIFKIF